MCFALPPCGLPQRLREQLQSAPRERPHIGDAIRAARFQRDGARETLGRPPRCRCGLPRRRSDCRSGRSRRSHPGPRWHPAAAAPYSPAAARTARSRRARSAPAADWECRESPSVHRPCRSRCRRGNTPTRRQPTAVRRRSARRWTIPRWRSVSPRAFSRAPSLSANGSNVCMSRSSFCQNRLDQALRRQRFLPGDRRIAILLRPRRGSR